MRYLIIAFSILALAACASYTEPEDSMDAGRQFVEAVYNGNFKRARLLLASEDAAQTASLQAIEQNFRSRNSMDKEALSKTPIVTDSVINLPSGGAMFYFQNAYTGRQGRIACQPIAGLWRVNLAQSQFFAKP